MTFKVEFETNNDAFVDNGSDQGRYEISRILKLIADKIEFGDISGNIRDINGNTIGTFEGGKPDEC